ncbi:MAG: hypothetical protein JNL08_14710 [Planctomycetes bacterium]|nr:hypothetical protein [Planctomycetota bacterium]
MNIVIAFQDQRPDEGVAYVARRAVEHALDRFAPGIRDVHVQIRDENGHKGGVDQRCTLALRTIAGQEFHLHDRDASPASAVHRLARRAARLVRESRRLRRGGSR